MFSVVSVTIVTKFIHGIWYYVTQRAAGIKGQGGKTGGTTHASSSVLPLSAKRVVHVVIEEWKNSVPFRCMDGNLR